MPDENDYVLDTSAILAFRGDEPGADRVEQILRRVTAQQARVFVSFMTRMELRYCIERDESAEAATEAIRLLDAAGVVWVSCEPEEPILPGVIEVLGDDFIMYASDYPHWDGAWPESTKHLRTRPDLRESSREKVAGKNALRFYGLA